MAVRFVLGRSGAGKTHHCVESLLRAIAAEPRDATGCLLIVPEQATFQMERELARRSPTGGFAGAEVLSFSRLATRVFEVTGGEPRILSRQTRTLALRSIATRMPETVAAFGAAARSEGFFAKLDKIIDELLREAVKPEDLARAASRLERPAARRRAAAIASVYSLYLQWLGPERADPAFRLALLRERLFANPRLAGSRIWVDGFAGFTGQEVETLVALGRLAARMEITLLCEPAAAPQPAADPFDLFRRTGETWQTLMRRFADENIGTEPPLRLDPATPPRFGKAPALAWLERALTGTPMPIELAPAAADAIRVVRCDTHLDELRSAAAAIRRQVVESGGALRFRDCAVIVRDLRPLVHDIADVFEEYGVPYFLDDRRPVAAHSLARLATALLEAARSDLSTTAGLRLLRTQLLPGRREDLEDLEQLLLQSEIRGTARWMDESWPEEHRCGKSVGELRRRIARAVLAVRRLLATTESPTGRDWGRALFAGLELLAAPRKIAAWIEESRERGDFDASEQHRLVWESLCEFFDDVDSVLVDAPLSIDEFAAVLTSALDEMSFGVAPATLDQVLVGSIDRSRHPELRRVWLVAMNEGIFPAPPAEDALLLPDERTALTAAGLAAPKSNRDDVYGERLLGYIAMTRASERLTLSYAARGDDDAELFPSPLVDEAIRAFGDRAIRVSNAGDGARLPEAPVVPAEFGRRALRSGQGPERGLWRSLERRLRARGEFAPAVEFLFRGKTYANIAGDLEATLRDDGFLWVGSPSELESYVQCPFQHLARYRLKLTSRRGPEPVEWSLGTAAHAILADVNSAASARDAGRMTDDEWTALLRSAISRWRERELESVGRTEHARFLASALEPFLDDVVRVHAARWRLGHFRPIAAERRFGRDENGAATTPAALETKAGRVGLRGSIDRVDAWDDGSVRRLLIYDYKPTARAIRGRFLTGHRLQAIAYSLVARELFTERGKHVEWAGALIAPLYPESAVLDRGYVAGFDEAGRRMMMYRPVGIFDEIIWPALHPGLEEGGKSPVAAITRQKNGRIAGDVVPRGELDAYGEAARETIAEAAKGIRDGRVAIEPLIEKRTLACRSCDYQRLCRFEPIFNDARVAEVRLPQINYEAPPPEAPPPTPAEPPAKPRRRRSPP